MAATKRRSIKRKINYSILIVELISILAIVFICFFVIQPKLIENVIAYDEAVTEQITSSISSYIDSLEAQSTYISSSEVLSNTLKEYENNPSEQNYNRIRLAIQSLINTSNDIRTVYIESDDGQIFTPINNATETDLQILEECGEDSLSFWSPFYIYNPSIGQYGTCHSKSIRINTSTYRFHFFYKITFLVSTIEALSTGHLDAYILTDYYGEPLFLSETDYIPAPDLSIKHTVCYKQDNGYYHTRIVSGCNWIFTGYAAYSTMLGFTRTLFYLVLGICIILCAFLWISNTTIVSRFIRPLSRLHQTMQKITESNELSARSDIHTNDEIEDLSEVFDSMLDHIQAHTEEVIAFQNQEQRLMYNLLIAQIDNHFISNTMTIINTLAREQDHENVIRVNTALMHIIQNTLRIKTFAITDTVEQEIHILNDYQTILHFRYYNDVKLHIDIPEELNHLLIPKSILQPVIENSFMHGLMDLDTGEIRGHIFLSMSLDNEKIMINIRDDGRGVPEDVLYALNHLKDNEGSSELRGKHIGLSNIQKRLDYIYKGEASMQFCNNGGLSVTYYLPVIKGEEV